MSATTNSPSFHLAEGFRSRVQLNDGTQMPVLGLGVFQVPNGPVARKTVRYALSVGYRLIDTAALYGNEKAVGEAVRDSGLSREEVFITTKLWNDDQGYESTLDAFERSRKALGVSSVDLYLIHWPVSGKRTESWRALLRLQREGKCLSVGVSNYTVSHLRELLRTTEVVPAVNQVEFSPFLFQRELLEFCRGHGIQLEAYAPLTKGRRLGDPTVARLARSHGATPAQVLIRWGLQHDVVEIPKSVQPQRILQNARALEIELSPEEMAMLDGLNEGFRTSWDPSQIP